jgi:hypothetical protein
MATARSDPLRSTLDNLELDPGSEADRPYLVAMLRRLGYTERDIEEVIRTGKMPTEAPAPADGLAPARDYRIVVPARDTRFALESAGGAAATDAPFEDLERLEFENPEHDVEFEAIPEEEPPVAAEPTWTEEPEAQPLLAAEGEGEAAETWQPVDEAEMVPETEEERALREQAERDAALETTPIDTFGDPNAQVAPAKTRVRVRRVRAGSKEEAERKVAGKGRTVIKSVPVDIVERWGANAKKADKPDDKKGGA